MEYGCTFIRIISGWDIPPSYSDSDGSFSVLSSGLSRCGQEKGGQGFMTTFHFTVSLALAVAARVPEE